MSSNKPTSEKEVLEVMQKYCKEKGYNFSEQQLDIMAQSCFFTFESKGWKGVTYWPPLAKRWILTNLDKQIKKPYYNKPQGKTVREQILEQEQKDGI